MLRPLPLSLSQPLRLPPVPNGLGTDPHAEAPRYMLG